MMPGAGRSTYRPPTYRLDAIQERIERQDAKYGHFNAGVAGVRLGLACLEDELAEALTAWRDERRAVWTSWPETMDEVLDIAAIAIRLLRDVEPES